MTVINSSFTKNDFEIVKRDELYRGFFGLARYHIRHRKFNGEWTNTFTCEVFERKSAAAVLPYDPVTDRVVLIEQFRPGAMSALISPWLVEIVAGVNGENESPESVAKREAEEEAGCAILDLHPICEYFVSPGGSNEYLHLFIGRINNDHADGLHGLKDENEDIRTFSISTDEAFKLINEHKMLTAPVIISLQWLQLNREWLKQLWQTK